MRALSRVIRLQPEGRGNHDGLGKCMRSLGFLAVVPSADHVTRTLFSSLRVGGHVKYLDYRTELNGVKIGKLFEGEIPAKSA